MQLFGNIPALNIERKMKCPACGGYPFVEVKSLSAEERLQIKVRRLHRTWWVRRVSWREE
jgi:hypothetical protein